MATSNKKRLRVLPCIVIMGAVLVVFFVLDKEVGPTTSKTHKQSQAPRSNEDFRLNPSSQKKQQIRAMPRNDKGKEQAVQNGKVEPENSGRAIGSDMDSCEGEINAETYKGLHQIGGTWDLFRQPEENMPDNMSSTDPFQAETEGGGDMTALAPDLNIQDTVKRKSSLQKHHVAGAVRTAEEFEQNRAATAVEGQEGGTSNRQEKHQQQGSNTSEAEWYLRPPTRH